MRLYNVLLASAVALVACNGFAAADEKCTMVTQEPVVPDVTAATPSGSSSYTSSGSSPDSSVTQGSDVGASQGSAPSDASFTSSYSGPTPDFPEYGNSQGSAPESPIQQGSDVGASQGSAPDTPIQQGSAPSDASFTSSYSGPTPDFPEYGNSQGSAPESPIQQGSDVGASQGSAPDSPVQQTSTTASGSQGSTMDAPVTQDSTAASGVDASQASTSASASASNSDDIKQGIVTPAGPADDDDASQKTDVAGESDINFQTTQVPTATTRAPTVVSSASGSSSSSVPTNNNSTTAATTKPSTTSADNSKLCAKPRIEITKVDVGATVDANEDEVALKPVAIAAIPSGGSRIAFQSGDSVVVQELDASDKLVSGSTVKVPLHDFADIYADEKGFVILGTRDAEGGGTLNCGNPSNLCGSAPNPAVPCYDMYMVRYDGAKESWATKLTSSSASLPPYSTGKTGPDVYMIWWYAHHGRIAFNGKNWAAYFGAAISTSEGGCINIHQGDRMKVVDATGKITADEDSFDWGCSHSGYERVTYDNRTDNFAAICKTDSNNRIMPPKDWGTTIYPVDLAASNLGDIVPDSSASSKKYWATVSNGNGDNAKVHLIHFALNAASSEDITLGGTDANERAPHLASIGSGGLLAMWEGSSSGGDLAEGGDRTIYAQVLDASNGKSISDKVTVDKSVVGNRYQALKSYPDGSVAYLSKGASDTSVQVVRFYGC
ncbi:hypothetical protein V7S43_015212 [Phytophthora oleae]|uniref:GPI-anchored protein n=1 Tax=Phytophthora oleae TaxID=2107226 RepID=A0ABD3F0F8_9STRA